MKRWLFVDPTLCLGLQGGSYQPAKLVRTVERVLPVGGDTHFWQFRRKGGITKGDFDPERTSQVCPYVLGWLRATLPAACVVNNPIDVSGREAHISVEFNRNIGRSPKRNVAAETDGAVF